jgi:hypothetical protein
VKYRSGSPESLLPFVGIGAGNTGRNTLLRRCPPAFSVLSPHVGQATAGTGPPRCHGAMLPGRDAGIGRGVGKGLSWPTTGFQYISDIN